jgi:hypothetical protein
LTTLALLPKLKYGPEYSTKPPTCPYLQQKFSPTEKIMRTLINAVANKQQKTQQEK